MYCSNCGQLIEENADVCPFCNSSLTKETVTEEKTTEEVVSNKKYSGKAIAGFIVSLVGILVLAIPCGIIGLVFSALGMKETETERKGKGLSIAGLVVSIIDVVLGIVMLAL